MRRASQHPTAWCFAVNWAIECLFQATQNLFHEQKGLKVPVNIK